MAKSRFARCWYEIVRTSALAFGVGYFRLRWYGIENLPASGGYLLLSNHQSHLDPPLIGAVVPRHINYLARDSLFKNRLFGAFIRSLDAIPIDRNGLGIAGLKETLRRLKRGEIVLLFPEGTRSPNGEIQPLMPGFSALVDRGGVPIVPLVIDGAYDALPRNARWPRPKSIMIEIGAPISVETARSMDDRALVALVDERLHALQAAARSRRKAAVR